MVLPKICTFNKKYIAIGKICICPILEFCPDRVHIPGIKQGLFILFKMYHGRTRDMSCIVKTYRIPIGTEFFPVSFWPYLSFKFLDIFMIVRNNMTFFSCDLEGIPCQETGYFCSQGGGIYLRLKVHEIRGKPAMVKMTMGNYHGFRTKTI